MASSATTYNTTWTTPRTWAAGELVTATIMNSYVRDQQNALKTPASVYGYLDEAADYTIASTTFADVDGSDLAFTFTTGAGILCCMFLVTPFYSSGTGNAQICFDIKVDGTRYGGDDGITQAFVTSGSAPLHQSVMVFCAVPVDAGSHEVKLQWMRYTSSSVTAGLYAGAGTSQHDLHPQIFIWETA